MDDAEQVEGMRWKCHGGRKRKGAHRWKRRGHRMWHRKGASERANRVKIRLGQCCQGGRAGNTVCILFPSSGRLTGAYEAVDWRAGSSKSAPNCCRTQLQRKRQSFMSAEIRHKGRFPVISGNATVQNNRQLAKDCQSPCVKINK